MSARILAIANQKGGVGKTTTAVSLAAALSQAGQRILLVDLDPQGHATLALGYPKSEVTRSVFEVLLEDYPIARALAPPRIPGLDLVPANAQAAGLELLLIDRPHRELLLKQSLATIVGNYDYILIDCPPSLGLLTINALVAADAVLVPLQCEFLALEGLAQLLGTMQAVRERANPALALEGIVLTMFDGRTNLAREVAEEVRRYFATEPGPHPVFAAVIPRSVRLAEAPSHGQPITTYDPASPGGQAYRELAQEVLAHAQARLARTRPSRAVTGPDPALVERGLESRGLEGHDLTSPSPGDLTGPH